MPRDRYFPINRDDAMKGIIDDLNKKNKTRYIYPIASSTSTLNRRSDVSYIFKHETGKYFQFNNDLVGEYIELVFRDNLAVTLTGYGIMIDIYNIAYPRNWNISCMSTNPPTLLANAVNDKTLCKSATSKTGCSTYDKQAFECSNKVTKCRNIRLTVTGPSSYGDNWHCIAIVGLELFGTLHYLPIEGKNSCSSRSFTRTHYFIICYLIY